MKALIFAICGLVVWEACGAQRRPPNYAQDRMPHTSFSCRDKIIGGYYADPETDCQMFHVCVKIPGRGVQDFRFLCPNDTSFDQENQICDDWYNIDCEASTLYYSDNFDLYRIGGDLGRVGGAKLPSNAVNNAVGEVEDNDYLRRDNSASDLLRGSHSSNFFSNRNRGREEEEEVKDVGKGEDSRGKVKKLITAKRPATSTTTPASYQFPNGGHFGRNQNRQSKFRSQQRIEQPAPQEVVTTTLRPRGQPYSQSRRTTEAVPQGHYNPTTAAPQPTTVRPVHRQHFFSSPAPAQTPAPTLSTPQQFQQYSHTYRPVPSTPQPYNPYKLPAQTPFPQAPAAPTQATHNPQHYHTQPPFQKPAPSSAPSVSPSFSQTQPAFHKVPTQAPFNQNTVTQVSAQYDQTQASFQKVPTAHNSVQTQTQTGSAYNQVQTNQNAISQTQSPFQYSQTPSYNQNSVSINHNFYSQTQAPFQKYSTQSNKAPFSQGSKTPFSQVQTQAPFSQAQTQTFKQQSQTAAPQNAYYQTQAPFQKVSTQQAYQATQSPFASPSQPFQYSEQPTTLKPRTTVRYNDVQTFRGQYSTASPVNSNYETQRLYKINTGAVATEEDEFLKTAHSQNLGASRLNHFHYSKGYNTSVAASYNFIPSEATTRRGTRPPPSTTLRPSPPPPSSSASTKEDYDYAYYDNNSPSEYDNLELDFRRTTPRKNR